ncbi:pyruvate kinase [Bacteroidota bacterium]
MKKLIITVGPSLFDKTNLSQIHQDSHIYRINCAHIDPESLAKTIQYIRNYIPKADILIDLPGNKIRTSDLLKQLPVYQGKDLVLKNTDINYHELYKLLTIGHSVYADDSTIHFTIKKINKNEVVLYSHSDGILKKNKGLHIRGIHSKIPFLFKKDIEIIKIANFMQVKFIGLSFVRSVKDIKYAEQFIDNDIILISKVETQAAVENLTSILNYVDHILVDRGDLSTEVGIERIPYYQKYIIDKAVYNNNKIFLATQFLKNMETNPIPTFPEVIDLYNTLMLGIYGIQLSEETAVGKFPVECLNLVNSIQNEIIAQKITSNNNQLK